MLPGQCCAWGGRTEPDFPFVGHMQYTPLNFLRRVPNPLLERFFSRFEQFAGFDWANTKETKIGSIAVFVGE